MDRALRVRVNDQLVLGAFDVYSDGSERPVVVDWIAAMPFLLLSGNNGSTCTVKAGAETSGAPPLGHYSQVVAHNGGESVRFLAEIGPSILAEYRLPAPTRVGTIIRLLSVNGQPET